MQIDNFETTDESQNESKILSLEVSSSSSNSNFQVSICSLTEDPVI